MSNQLLKGKTGIIFGALDEASIAWAVAERAAEEGAQFILTNTALALRMGKVKELADKLGTDFIPADVTKDDELEALIDAAQAKYGGVDFILHAVGMSPNVRKKRGYTNLNYDWYQKTLDISAVSLHRLLQICMDKDAINEGGSVVALSYIAAQRVFPDYGDMADAKSLLESIARGFGYHYGVKKRVRVNTVSQSPTLTTAGKGVKGMDAFFNYADETSPLGNADAQSCADFCITLFSDLTRMVTMQNLFHDGGFSTTGVSQSVVEKFGGK